MATIGIIIGSTRENRIGLPISEWVHHIASSSGRASYKLLDLKQINLPLLDEPYPAAAGNYQHAHTKEWAKIVNGCDGFIIVTPEYNRGYPPALKNALDYLYQEWHNKPVLFVGYGYAASGLRAIEQLRQVINNLLLKPLANEVVINLGATVVEGKFAAPESLEQYLKTCLITLEDLLD